MTKIAYVATYPPRKCGIATFTGNLVRAIHPHLTADDLSREALVIAMQDAEKVEKYPAEVKFIISQNVHQDYIHAADFIEQQGAKVCILQHEFGIFGGNEGVFILSLIKRLKVPLIVTLHTVLEDPTYLQKIILQEITVKADRIVVMSRKAIFLLTHIYHIPISKIVLIGHGIPDSFSQTPSLQKTYFPEDKTILFTFGLLSRNKGIETVIRALPKVVTKHPEIRYFVLGKTHPAVIRTTGEAYRDNLKHLVKCLNLEKHVHFIEEFVSEDQLTRYLSATDIYITPYLNEAQITSGTLSYAVGAGTAVVSTPYWHAQELLAEGRGRLFPFGDSAQLADILLELLDSPEKLKALRQKAYSYGQQFTWSKTGSQYRRLINMAQRRAETNGLGNASFLKKKLPPIKLDHILCLTDSTGIMQHAKYDIPNRKEGYCLDDNARALLFSIMTWKQQKAGDALKLMPIYLSFIQYMQSKDGSFHNFLGFDRQYLDIQSSEDAFGRTLWALGYLIRFAPKQHHRKFATELFLAASSQFQKLESLRGIANTIIGISHYLKYYSADEVIMSRLLSLTQKISTTYERYAQPGKWDWPEDKLTYDNGILPLALWCSYEITGNKKTKSIAQKCTSFLEAKTLYENYLNPVGNKGWYEEGQPFTYYDQQPIEAMAMVLLYKQAYAVSHKRRYLNNMLRCYSWFLGENSLGIPLYDIETGGCHDGLESTGLNYNQGAESTLAHVISRLTVAETRKLKIAPTLLQPQEPKAQKTDLSQKIQV